MQIAQQMPMARLGILLAGFASVSGLWAQTVLLPLPAGNAIDNQPLGTGVATELAIRGDGYFVVRDPVTGESFATRRGDFRVDARGWMTSIQGFRLQGFNETTLADYADTAPVGDLVLDKGKPPLNLGTTASAEIANLNIDSSGKLNVLLSDGSQYVRGQVLLQKFGQPQRLISRYPHFFVGWEAAQPLAQPQRPTSAGLGSIVSGALDRGLFSALPGATMSYLLSDPLHHESRLLLAPGPLMSQLQTSVDLVNWRSVATNRNFSHLQINFSIYFADHTQFLQNTRDGGPVRFYRVLSPTIRQTGVPTDLAVSGEGFFLLKDPFTGEHFVTRNGHFKLDSANRLVSEDGFRLQGYNTPIRSTEDFPSPNPTGDLVLNKGILPAGLLASANTAEISNINIDLKGKIQVLLSDGSQYTRGQIPLQNFWNLFALIKVDRNLYRFTSAARPFLGRPGSGDDSVGTINAGALESFPLW